MFRSKFNFMVILFSCLLAAWSVVYAQSTLFSPSTSKAQTPIPGTSKVMTPEEFQSHVKELGQQTQEKAQQDAQAIIAKDQPAPAPKISNPVSTDQNAMENAFPPEPAPAAQPAPRRSSGEVPSGLPEAPSNSSNGASPSSGATQPSSQPYTGFGAGDTGGSSSSPQKSSGGWNIKY